MTCVQVCYIVLLPDGRSLYTLIRITVTILVHRYERWMQQSDEEETNPEPLESASLEASAKARLLIARAEVIPSSALIVKACVCVCVCWEHTHMMERVPMHVNREKAGGPALPLESLETGRLAKPGVRLAAGNPTFTPCTQGDRHVQPHLPSFYMGSGDLNSRNILTQ